MRFLSTITNILWTQIVSKFLSPIGTIQVGKYTYGDPFFLTLNKNCVVIIGKFCQIAPNVTIIGMGGSHTTRNIANYPLLFKFKYPCSKTRNVPAKYSSLLEGEIDPITKRKTTTVIIGNDVWIGTGVIILPGVKIGDGAVVGAGAVVTHDVPSYAVVAGVPAKVLHYRFTQKQIDALLKIAWWNWSIDKITEEIDYFYGDIDTFIEKFSEKTLEGNTATLQSHLADASK